MDSACARVCAPHLSTLCCISPKCLLQLLPANAVGTCSLTALGTIVQPQAKLASLWHEGSASPPWQPQPEATMGVSMSLFMLPVGPRTARVQLSGAPSHQPSCLHPTEHTPVPTSQHPALAATHLLPVWQYPFFFPSTPWPFSESPDCSELFSAPDTLLKWKTKLKRNLFFPPLISSSKVSRSG